MWACNLCIYPNLLGDIYIICCVFPEEMKLATPPNLFKEHVKGAFL